MNSRTVPRMWQNRNKQPFTDKKSALNEADFLHFTQGKMCPRPEKSMRRFCRRGLQGLGKAVDERIFPVGAYLG